LKASHSPDPTCSLKRELFAALLPVNLESPLDHRAEQIGHRFIIAGQAGAHCGKILLPFSTCLSSHLLWCFTAQVVRNEPELFECGFEVVDDFLGDDIKCELWEMVPDSFISPTIFIP